MQPLRLTRASANWPATYAAVAVIGAFSGVLTTSLPIQVLAFTVAALTALSLTNTQLLYVAALLLCVLGFVRRIMAGDLGRIDNDPLVLLPLILVIIVVTRTLLEPTRNIPTNTTAKICYIMAALSLVTYLVNLNLSLSAIYPSALAIVTWVLIGLICSARTPDVWPLIYKYFPFVGALIGSYGIFQFFYLPSWDRAWMIASRLTSIGAPYPEQVRVFGTTESPGPFAIVLGLCLIITLERSISERGFMRLTMALIACALLAPLALTAVRTGILGIVLAGLFMSLRCLKGTKRLIPIAASILIYIVLTVFLRLFGRGSSVLTEDRISEFDASNDTSLQARLQLLVDTPQYFSSPLGRGVAVDPSTGQSASLDNAFIDTLVRNGPAMALLLIILMVLVLRAAWRVDITAGNKVAAAACSVYLAFFTIAGNIFASGTGILCAMIIGTTLRYYYEQTMTGPPNLKAGEDGLFNRTDMRTPRQPHPSPITVPGRR